MNKSIRRILIGTVLFLMGVMILLAILILTKTVCINKMFVSDDDIIGVDVSEYQDKIDMKRLSEQNIDFVYIRATEGSSYQDACFRENWKNAHECGLLAGAYHFFSFDSSGETQARNYIETVGELEGDLIPVVDFEYYGDKEKNRPDKEKVLRELHIFLEILEKEYGVKPMIYTLKNIYSVYLDDEVDGYPLWVRNVFYPASFDGWGDYVIWQYLDTAQLDGYSGGEKYIDMDVLADGMTLEKITLHKQ